MTAGSSNIKHSQIRPQAPRTSDRICNRSPPILYLLCSTIAPSRIKVSITRTYTAALNLLWTYLGGIVLWSRSFTPDAAHLASSSASPVNSLIREALIEGRTAEEKYEKDGYAVKWTFVNDLELIFVVGKLTIIDLLNIDATPLYLRSHTSASFN